jgi:hypothetical protein
MRASVMTMMIAALLSTDVIASQAKPQPKVPQRQVRMLPGHALLVYLPVSASTRTWYGGRKPDLNVTAADIKIIIDQTRTLPALGVEPDKKTPGSYVVSFSPPLDLRDRKPHQVEIKIKNASSKTTMAF